MPFQRVCESRGNVWQWKAASDLHQPGHDKASVCVVFVCNELCLILHNLCSGRHVTTRKTEGEKQIKPKREERSVCPLQFSHCCFSQNILLTNLILPLTTNHCMSCGSGFNSAWVEITSSYKIIKLYDCFCRRLFSYCYFLHFSVCSW